MAQRILIAGILLLFAVAGSAEQLTTSSVEIPTPKKTLSHSAHAHKHHATTHKRTASTTDTQPVLQPSAVTGEPLSTQAVLLPTPSIQVDDIPSSVPVNSVSAPSARQPTITVNTNSVAAQTTDNAAISATTASPKAGRQSQTNNENTAVSNAMTTAATDIPASQTTASIARTSAPVQLPAPSLFSRYNLAHIASSATARLIELVHGTINHLTYSCYKLGGTYFNELSGVYKVDCSDYVDHMLSAANPSAYQAMTIWTHTNKPTSGDYYTFFTNLPDAEVWQGWYKIKQVSDLQPGDILVFRYRHIWHRRAGGHVMIIVNKSILASSAPNVYLVRVSDSAVSGHSNDTRAPHSSGIGIGTLLLKVNPATGEPYAYAWKLGASWQYNMIFAMARPIGQKLD